MAITVARTREELYEDVWVLASKADREDSRTDTAASGHSGVSSRLTSPHPLVKQAREFLAHANEDERSIVNGGQEIGGSNPPVPSGLIFAVYGDSPT